MMTLHEAASALDRRYHGADVTFRRVHTDSRTISDGDLFVALRGERFDGSQFVPEARGKGAVAAMVEVRSEGSPDPSFPYVLVDDTRRALGDLAAYWRGKFTMPLVALTGSNGKTTVKEMLASILRVASAEAAGRATVSASPDPVLATRGNLNNDIGVPLTLLELRAAHRFAVIEMGMNHPGEIAYLTRLAKPDVALVNNANAAHLEGLGTVEAVARAKGEIFEGLADEGIAVINADDAYAPLWRKLARGKRIVDFGLDQPAQISAQHAADPEGIDLVMQTPGGKIRARLAVPGVHNVRNALAASAAALALSIDPPVIGDGLRNFSGIKGRLQRKRGRMGVVLIDDTYNANPASMRAAIAVLAAVAGRKILVMGDMGELGSEARDHHAALGEVAKNSGIDALYALGETSAAAAEKFGRGARHFVHLEGLLAALQAELAADTTVLVKGSRFMKMERVVEALQAEGTK